MQKEIHVRNVTKQFYKRDVLSNISFEVAPGEIVAVIGPNGSGKSTLISLLTGLMEPTQGEISINGRTPGKSGSRIGYVPQRFAIDRTLPLTVSEFLDLALCNTKEHKHEKTILRALERVGMQSFLQAQIGTLSGGELQRILIARAILHERSILILDEPEASIDIEQEAELYSTLHAINKEYGTTIIIISHELETVLQHVDRVIGLNTRLVFDVSKEQMIADSGLLRELYHPNCVTCEYC